MSAFEDFVQLELPKRPYLNTDVAQETVIVRRGAGPRQLGAVALTNGQVLGMVGGTLQGVAVGEGATFRKFVLEVTTASTTWTVTHNLNSTNFIAQAFDATGAVIIPDEILTVDADEISVEFNTPQAGIVRVIFLD